MTWEDEVFELVKIKLKESDHRDERNASRLNAPLSTSKSGGSFPGPHSVPSRL